MATYAAVVSLLQTLEQLQEDAHQSSNILHHLNPQIQYLQDKVRSFKFFLENSNSSHEDLEALIRQAVFVAGDTIEYFLSRESTEESDVSRFSESVRIIIQEIDSIVEISKNNFAEEEIQEIDSLAAEIQEIDSIPEEIKETHSVAKRTNKFTNQVRRDSTDRASSVLHLRSRSQTVGRENDLRQLKNRLTEEEEGSTRLAVVPIVGIAGIGKSFLAQLVYNDPEITQKFKTRAWVKVSLEYGKRDILIGLLRSMKKIGRGKRQETDDELAKRLNKLLRSGRYLVVLDDVRDLGAWNDLKELFPDRNSGSRVMLTTRNVDLADCIGSFYQVHPFSREESFVLLEMTVFPYKACPPDLEEIAMKIAQSCRGLPLAIVTIGRVLDEASTEDWRIVKSSISSCGKYEEIMEVVISLSYKSLPRYVKGCLLYMGIFPHSYEIPISKLNKLWIAEGFLELMGRFQTLEEMAEECLSRLVQRGLVSVCEWNPSGKIKTCKIDEAYCDFFMRKAEEEKFFHVIRTYTSGFPEDPYHQGRLCIHKKIRFGIKRKSKNNSKDSSLRSLLFAGPQQHPLWVWLDFKLLRVLDALQIRFYSFPPEILKLIHLRYLSLTYNGRLPASICKLWNLQFLIVFRHLSTKYSGAPMHLPVEIWNLKELRHLQFMGRDLPYPSTATLESEDGRPTSALLENLLTLSGVSSHSCTPGVLQRIPNLKKLGIQIETPVLDAAENFCFLIFLVILDHLESLKCVVMHPHFGSQVMVSAIPAFPPSLRKLSLNGCGFAWANMTVIAALPNLEVLKLRFYAFRGPEWKLNDGGFLRLKFLLLEDMDIVHWEANSGHFPLLTSLIIRHCYQLRKIPHGIGDIPTLKVIELLDGSQSAMESAQKIHQEQLRRGYKDIQVDLQSSRDD